MKCPGDEEGNRNLTRQEDDETKEGLQERKRDLKDGAGGESVLRGFGCGCGGSKLTLKDVREGEKSERTRPHHPHHHNKDRVPEETRPFPPPYQLRAPLPERRHRCVVLCCVVLCCVVLCCVVLCCVVLCCDVLWKEEKKE